MPRLCSFLLSLLIASAASAVTMSWTPVGNPGNAADSQMMSDGTTGYGSIAYFYSIGTYEVTNAQYAEFLNAKAASDALGLYSVYMGMTSLPHRGGITRSGGSGSYTYSAISGRENMPVNYVSFNDAIRFANWMNNGQGNADTETGSYMITSDGIANNSIVRTPGSQIAIPSENEWYKAAYYAPFSSSYFDYPTRSNGETICSTPSVLFDRANCADRVIDFTNVGSYPSSASPYGTFDQGGNVEEWNESILSAGRRGVRGGNWDIPASNLFAGGRGPGFLATDDFSFEGFRLVMIPEPGTGLLVFAGLLGLGLRRQIVD